MNLEPVSLKASEKPQKNHCVQRSASDVHSSLRRCKTHLERDDSQDGHREEDHGQCILAAEEARVEEADTGNHNPHKRSGGDDPGHVPKVENDGVTIGVELVVGNEVASWSSCQ